MPRTAPAAPFDPYGQLLPSDENAERYVIATSLQFDHRMREFMALLEPDHFSLERNRVVWRTMRQLWEAEKPVTAESAILELDRHPDMEEAISTVVDCRIGECMPDVRIEHWAKPILETWARRRLMLKCNEVMLRLSDRLEPPETICQELEEEARACASVGDTSMGFATFADVVREAGGFDAFLARSATNAVAYPWQRLNELANGGMRGGQVIVVAGRSGRGKTALALNIALSAAMSGNGVPLVFSLEMQRPDIKTRLLALASMVDSYHFQRADAEERTKLRRGRQLLEENIVATDDEDCVTVPSMRAKVQKYMSAHKVSLVLVDYIQLVESKRAASGEIREQEIARVMRGLKRMAMQLKVPVVALSQLKDVPGDRVPEGDDLRESRSIFHTANQLLLLHFTRHYDMAAGMPTGELDLILAKQSNGPTGKVPLTFHAPTGRFYE